jgi:hypothetical protein
VWLRLLRLSSIDCWELSNVSANVAVAILKLKIFCGSAPKYQVTHWSPGGKPTDKNVKVIFQSLIWTVVLYEFETWSLTLWEKHSSRMFENRVLRISESMIEEVIWEWWSACRFPQYFEYVEKLLLNMCGVNDVRKTETHTAEPLVP